MTDEKRIEEIEKKIEMILDAFAKDAAELSKTPGYDRYNPKWQKKMDKIADKYAELLHPLKLEHQELRINMNIKQEQERRAKYIRTDH